MQYQPLALAALLTTRSSGLPAAPLTLTLLKLLGTTDTLTAVRVKAL